MADEMDFQDVEATLARFIFADKRLWLMEPPGKFELANPCFLPNIA